MKKKSKQKQNNTKTNKNKIKNKKSNNKKDKKNKKRKHTVGTVPKSNRKFVMRGKMSIKIFHTNVRNETIFSN
jgi:hypothetical protein